MRHLVFICGIEGTEANSQPKFEKLLEKTFKEIVKKGFSEEQVSSALYQLELSRREFLQHHCLMVCKYFYQWLQVHFIKANPLELSNVDEALNKLKRKRQGKRFSNRSC